MAAKLQLVAMAETRPRVYLGLGSAKQQVEIRFAPIALSKGDRLAIKVEARRLVAESHEVDAPRSLDVHTRRGNSR